MRTEEEQVEALKQWWKDNGKSLVLTIALSVGAVLSWNAYQDYQLQQAEAASGYFQRLLNNAPAGLLSDKDIANIRHNSELLKTEFGSSVYAQFAGLMVARVEVQVGDLAAAAAELEWILEQQGDAETAAIAAIRLAKVLAAQGMFDQAMVLLVDADDAWQLGRLEARGDLLVEQGQLGAARDAYSEALDLAASSGANKPLLSLKLDNLAQ
jgi:predicted negative regulator of RcsB-dependent stress response